MKTRCPFGDCAHIFDAGDDMAYKPGICAACSRPITIRSLERHEAVDHVVEKHRANGTLFLPELFQQQSPLPRMVAVLEDIRSLWNVGSMFRTADGSGCQHLIVTGITGYPPRKEIEKTSLGAEAVVSWNYAANSMSVIPEFKKLGYQILSLEKDEKSLPLSTVIGGNLLRFPLCIVVGNEVTGLYLETLQASDYICHLPMRGMKTSLNVAVAFGIAAYKIAESTDPIEL